MEIVDQKTINTANANRRTRLRDAELRRGENAVGRAFASLERQIPRTRSAVAIDPAQGCLESAFIRIDAKDLIVIRSLKQTLKWKLHPASGIVGIGILRRHG